MDKSEEFWGLKWNNPYQRTLCKYVHMLKIFTQIWTYLQYYEHFYNILNIFTIFWTYLQYCEHIYNIVNIFTIFWTYLQYYEHIYSIVNIFTILWRYLQYYEHIYKETENIYTNLNIFTIYLPRGCQYFPSLVTKTGQTTPLSYLRYPPDNIHLIFKLD